MQAIGSRLESDDHFRPLLRLPWSVYIRLTDMWNCQMHIASSIYMQFIGALGTSTTPTGNYHKLTFEAHLGCKGQKPNPNRLIWSRKSARSSSQVVLRCCFRSAFIIAQRLAGGPVGCYMTKQLFPRFGTKSISPNRLVCKHPLRGRRGTCLLGLS